MARRRKSGCWISGALVAVIVMCGGLGLLFAPGSSPPDGSAPSVGAERTPSTTEAPSLPAPPSAVDPPPLSPVAIPPVPTLEPLVVVTRVVDGDTIDTTAGRIRLIGIDTPERGDCNATAATDALQSLINSAGNQVRLVPGAREDTDRYGRLLRYVEAPDGTDLNLQLVNSGLAVARYDSRDGYGSHPREATYIASDATSESPAC